MYLPVFSLFYNPLIFKFYAVAKSSHGVPASRYWPCVPLFSSSHASLAILARVPRRACGSVSAWQVLLTLLFGRLASFLATRERDPCPGLPSLASEAARWDHDSHARVTCRAGTGLAGPEHSSEHLVFPECQSASDGLLSSRPGFRPGPQS